MARFPPIQVAGYRDPPHEMMQTMVTLLLIVLGALVLFFTEWVEVEITAILVMAALLVTGILDLSEAISGFSSEATVVVAGLLIMSSAIERTGALQLVANRFLV